MSEVGLRQRLSLSQCPIVVDRRGCLGQRRIVLALPLVMGHLALF